MRSDKGKGVLKEAPPESLLEQLEYDNQVVESLDLAQPQNLDPEALASTDEVPQWVDHFISTRRAKERIYAVCWHNLTLDGEQVTESYIRDVLVQAKHIKVNPDNTPCKVSQPNYGGLSKFEQEILVHQYSNARSKGIYNARIYAAGTTLYMICQPKFNKDWKVRCCDVVFDKWHHYVYDRNRGSINEGIHRMMNWLRERIRKEWAKSRIAQDPKSSTTPALPAGTSSHEELREAKLALFCKTATVVGDLFDANFHVYIKAMDNSIVSCNAAFADFCGVNSGESLSGLNEKDVPWDDTTNADLEITRNKMTGVTIVQSRLKADGSPASFFIRKYSIRFNTDLFVLTTGIEVPSSTQNEQEEPRSAGVIHKGVMDCIKNFGLLNE